MPTLSSRGDVTHGVGGGYASLNNAAFSRGAAGGFIDDDTIAFIDGTDDLWVASRYHIPTRSISRLADVQANHMFAGGGHAAWWFGAQSDARGVHATTGFRAPDAGLLGMGPDAAIVYKPSYQSDGPTMVREFDGSDWKLTDGHADYLSVHGERRILWMERMQVHTCNMPQPRYVTDGGIWKAEAVFAGGAWWITYYSGAHGIVLHPFDSFIGFAHLPKGDGWHSARAIGERTIRIATAVSVAEQVGQIWVRDYDVVANRVRDPWGANVWQSMDCVDVRTINQPDPRVAYSDKNLSCGTFFCYSDRYGDEPDVPEHCTVVVEPGAVARAAARVPIIVSGEDSVLDAALAVKDRVLALYIGDTAGWQDAEARATELKARWKAKSGRDTPVLWYITPSEPEQPGFRVPPSVDVLGPEFYFSDWNNLAEQQARKLAMWIGALRASKPWVPICQAYDRSVWPAAAMDSLAALMPSLVSQFFSPDSANGARPEVIGVLFFAVGRPGGMRTYPALKTAYKSIVGAVRGPGAWPTSRSGGGNVIPEVTITSYEPKDGLAPLRVRAVAKLTDPDHRIRALEWLFRPIGTQTWITAAHNPADDPDHTYTFTAAGTYEIKLRGIYEGGTAETGLQRLVTARSAPPPDPPERRGIKSSLQTVSGKYLNAGPDGLCVVGDHPQELEFIEVGGGEMALRGPNGKFAAAEDGGGREIRFRSDSVAGEWEVFKVARLETGVSLQAHTSRLFVCAENAGDGPVLVNRQSAGPWETFTAVPPIWPVPTLEGRVRVEGRAFVNDAGLFRPCFVSALSVLAKSDDGVNAYLDWTVRTGFNGIRVFAGALAWANQTAADARSRLPKLLDKCVAHGLYCEVTALTDTKDGRYDKREHVRALGDICSGYTNTLLEIANEYFHETQDNETHDPNYLLRLRREVVPTTLATALGAGETDEPDPRNVPQADWISLHLDRQQTRGKWDQVRRVRELENASASYNKPVMNNEPIGADERDGGDTGRKERIADPAFFFAMGVLNRLFEIGGVHHSEHGRTADLPGPNQQACADAYIRGFNVVKTNARLTFKNAKWADSPVGDAAFDAGIVRAFSGLAQDGSENVLVLLGLTGDPRVSMQNGWTIGETLSEMPGVRVVRLLR